MNAYIYPEKCPGTWQVCFNGEQQEIIKEIERTLTKRNRKSLEKKYNIEIIEVKND